MRSEVATMRTALSGDMPGDCGLGILTWASAGAVAPNKVIASRMAILVHVDPLALQ